MKNTFYIFSILIILSKNSFSQIKNCTAVDMLGTRIAKKDCFYLESFEKIRNLKNKNLGIYFTYEMKNADSIQVKINQTSDFKEKFVVDSLHIFTCKKVFNNKIKKESKILFDKKQLSFVLERNLNIYIVMEYEKNYSNAFVFECKK